MRVVAVIALAATDVCGSFYYAFITRPIIECSNPESLLVHNYHHANQTPKGVSLREREGLLFLACNLCD